MLTLAFGFGQFVETVHAAWSLASKLADQHSVIRRNIRVGPLSSLYHKQTCSQKPHPSFEEQLSQPTPPPLPAPSILYVPAPRQAEQHPLRDQVRVCRCGGGGIARDGSERLKGLESSNRDSFHYQFGWEECVVSFFYLGIGLRYSSGL